MTLPVVSGGQLLAYLLNRGCSVVTVESGGAIVFLCAPLADRLDPLVDVAAVHPNQQTLSQAYVELVLRNLGFEPGPFWAQA
jgi:hypothetical protein